ncbi:MAG: signal peptidase II [Pirellulaceae bacterium]
MFSALSRVQSGTLFGIGQGGGLALAIIAIVAVVGIVVWLFVFKAGKDWWLLVPMSLVMGGILGNLCDRLIHGMERTPPFYEVRAVRDWDYFRLQGVPGFDPWPNFKLADSLLVCGRQLLSSISLGFCRGRKKARALAWSESMKPNQTVNPSA